MRLIRYMSIIMLVVLSVSCESGGKMYAIVISPSEVVVAEGKTQQFEATAFFTDGTTLIWTSAVAWAVIPADTTTTGSTPTIGNSLGSYGLVTATTGTGDFTVQATDAANNLSGSALIYVRQPAITISPANAYLPLNSSHQFTATGTMVKSEGTLTTMVDLTSSVTWATTAGDSVTVDTRGLVTSSSMTTGPSDLSALYIVSGATITSAATVVNVTPVAVTSITIRTDPLPVTTLAPLGTTNVVATGIYPPGTIPDQQDFTRSVTWTSSDTSIATISSEGLVSALTKTGPVTITATDPVSSMPSSNSIFLEVL